MLKQLFSQTFNMFGNKIISQRNKERTFLNSTIFAFASTLSPYSYVSNWNFPKISNEFKC